MCVPLGKKGVLPGGGSHLFLGREFPLSGGEGGLGGEGEVFSG